MAIFFFSMLFTLGVGSAVGLLSNLTTNLKDYFPKLKYWQLALIGAVGGFLTGLVYVTHGGIYIVDLVDHFGGQFLIFALATVEIIGVMWIYGLENICWDVEFMLNRKLSAFWRVSWCLGIPSFLLTISVYLALTMENPLYEGKSYPLMALIVGWTLFAIGLGQVAIGAGYVIFKKRHDNDSTLKYLLSPNPEWGPKSNSKKAEWITFKQMKLRERDEIIASQDHSWLKQKCWLLLGKYP